MKLSERQQEWLTHLRDNGPDASHSRVGHFCRTNGLTEWQCQVKEGGELISRTEAEARWPQPETWLHVNFTNKELITPAGLKALEEG